YYFTIHDLRKAVIAFDMDSEINETDWKDKIIGGRKVFKSEVERARRFVSLLRDLFGNLMHTTQKSIAPDVQLAALALENAKAEEEETVRSMMNEVITFTDDNAHTGAVNTGENDPSNDVSNGTSNDNFLNSSETKMEFSESSTSEMMDTDINAGLPAFGESRPSYERYSAAHMMKKTAALRTSYGTDYTASNTFTSRNDYNGKGKNKESHDGPDLEGTFMTSAEPIREEKPRTASSMLFGRQQDVAECMDNVMFQLEAAITPTILPSGEYINVVKNLFYGKTQQILRYKDKTTGNMVQAMKEEPFNQLFVVVTEGRDLYGGLDGYFDVSMVDYKGSQAEREVTISELPPILQIQLQRVQFDRSTANSYKSNAYMRFDKIVYLDRYLYSNREILQDRRRLAASWRQQLELLTEKVKELTERK
ncbi:6794_t:CDS:2, partial [Paraglomus occultum]